MTIACSKRAGLTVDLEQQLHGFLGRHLVKRLDRFRLQTIVIDRSIEKRRLAASEIMRAGGDVIAKVAAEEIRLLLIAVRWQEGWPQQVNDIILDCHHRLAQPFIEQDNLFAQPSEHGTRIVPGTLGAASWSPVAFDPNVNAVYIAGIYQPSVFHSIKLDPKPGKPWESYTYFKATDEPDWGIFSAISLDTGNLLWQQKISDPMVGGALATAGGLVFTGEGNGQFDAFHSETGKLLWQFEASYGVNAPPISYAINGKQYIAVAAGGNKIFGYKTGDEILVFALDN